MEVEFAQERQCNIVGVAISVVYRDDNGIGGERLIFSQRLETLLKRYHIRILA